MCRVLKVHRGGFYAWLKEPQSPRALENASYRHRSIITTIKVWGSMAARGFNMTSKKPESAVVRTVWQDS
jgi:hypothetical protein